MRTTQKMLRAILNKFWKQHPTKQQLFPSHLKNHPIRRTRHAGYCWRSKEELKSDILPWTPTQEWASVDRPTRTYVQTLDVVWRTCRQRWRIGMAKESQGNLCCERDLM